MAIHPLPERIRNDPDMQSACVGGAITAEELRQMLSAAGFEQIRIATREENRNLIKNWAPGQGIENQVVSAVIEAVRPIY